MADRAPLVSVIIPTRRRPEGLARAARSVFRQTAVDFDRIELVIVDNDRLPLMASLADELRAEAPLFVRYIHEPHPGVASARNAAVAAARGQRIAFLDDDEEASEGWLAGLLDAMDWFGADVVFGPVRGRAPDHVLSHRDYLERFFSRVGPAEAGPIDRPYGCGNSLLRRKALPVAEAPFAIERNTSGGEDNLLFETMRRAGAEFAWAPDAWVWEDPAPSRLSLGYTLKRAFAYGQAPAADCAAAGRWNEVIRWMAIGLGQAVVFGLIAALQWLVRAPSRAFPLDRAAQGLGKALWWGAFRLNFYGEAG